MIYIETEQKPRGWWNPSYPALSVQLTKPHDGGGWEPFFTTPPLPEPAPKEAGFHDKSGTAYSFATECAGRDSDSIQKEFTAYVEEQNKLCALNHLPPRPEPAHPCRQNPYYSGPRQCALGTVGCTVYTHWPKINMDISEKSAAPSSDEVREMVEWLRDCDHANKRRYRAADLIERLAARVPDGCVVVPREPTEAMCQAASARCHHPQALYKTAYKAMIAAYKGPSNE